MDGKIIFLDLDGTLLNSQKKVSLKNRKAIEAVIAAGHKVVIATGRTLVSSLETVEALGLKKSGCYLIACNGAVLYDLSDDRVLQESTISHELVCKVFAEANKKGLHVQTYSPTHVLVEKCNDDDGVRKYRQLSGMPFKVLNSINAYQEPVHKILLLDYDDNSEIRKFRDHVKELFKGELDSFFSAKPYIEIVRFGVSKATAVKNLCALLEIQLKNSFAVGDAANDLGMIQAAGTGIAMQNATDEVKKVADYVTENDNDHDGVAEFIEKLILNV